MKKEPRNKQKTRNVNFTSLEIKRDRSSFAHFAYFVVLPATKT